MDTIFVLFSRQAAFASLLLRTFMWSNWSHCAIVTKDGTVVEATALHGVRERLMTDALRDSSAHELVAFTVHDADAIIAAARSQLGKPYDWWGVLGIAFRRKWSSSNRWFCSKFVAWSFGTGGTSLFRVKLFRITPRDLNIPVFGNPPPL